MYQYEEYIPNIWMLQGNPNVIMESEYYPSYIVTTDRYGYRKKIHNKKEEV